jgi:hypothetical protein
MTGKMAYAIGILTLVLSVACCTKRLSTASIPEENVAALAAWIPEEMEGFAVVSSLEALKNSLEQLKARSSLKQFEEFLEAFQEGLQEKTKLDLFSLSTWQEMGLHIQAPLAFGMQMRRETLLLAALPVTDHALFLAAAEKHLALKGAWEAQPGMPQGLRAWKRHDEDFVVVAQKPGYALVLLGDELEVLQKAAQVPRERSWARHKDVLLKIDSRLPADRIASLWVRIDEDRDEIGWEWIGAAMTIAPRAKVVVDVTWREREEAFLPKMQTVVFDPKQWPQGLGDALGGVWSSVTLDWYAQVLQHPSLSRGMRSEQLEKLYLFKQSFERNFEPPVLLRGFHSKAGDGGFEGGFHWSVDVALQEGSSAQQLLTWVSLVAEDTINTTQPYPGLSIWKAQVKKQELFAHASGQNKARIADSLHSYERNVPNALQKVVMQEMINYPMAVAFHLNALMESPMFRFILGRRPLEKAEYMLLGLRAEEDHAQLTAEHFVETELR